MSKNHTCTNHSTAIDENLPEMKQPIRPFYDSVFSVSKQRSPHMPFTIHIRMKKLGKQKPSDLQPVPFELDEKPGTVRELLTSLTTLGVKQYNARKDEGQILAYLTKEEIADQAVRGKIASGLRGGEDAVEEKALENTIQCFEDGIFRVFAGDTELTALEEAIPWKDDLIFTFIRLTMLSGW